MSNGTEQEDLIEKIQETAEMDILSEVMKGCRLQMKHGTYFTNGLSHQTSLEEHALK